MPGPQAGSGHLQPWLPTLVNYTSTLAIIGGMLTAVNMKVISTPQLLVLLCATHTSPSPFRALFADGRLTLACAYTCVLSTMLPNALDFGCPL